MEIKFANRPINVPVVLDFAVAQNPPPQRTRTILEDTP